VHGSNHIGDHDGFCLAHTSFLAMRPLADIEDCTLTDQGVDAGCNNKTVQFFDSIAIATTTTLIND